MYKYIIIDHKVSGPPLMKLHVILSREFINNTHLYGISNYINIEWTKSNFISMFDGFIEMYRNIENIQMKAFNC